MKSKKFIILILAAFILRLLLIPIAFHGDLNNNISWGKLASERGLANFYEGTDWPNSAPNQPPLTILLFAFTNNIWSFVDNSSWFLNNRISFFPSKFIWYWERQGMTLLVKLPSVLADLGIGWLIYKYFKEKKMERRGFILSALWLFNPVILYNSAVWGQTDPIVNLLGLVSILFLMKRKLVLSMIFIVLSLLFKGSLSIFLPILFVVMIWQKYEVKEWVRAFAACAICVVGISIWFHPAFDLPVWLFNLYNQRIFPGEIGYLTANAFNFWWIVDPGKVLDSYIYFGLSAHIWGYLLVIGIVLTLILWLKKHKFEEKYIFYALSLTALATFLFFTRIHERYLYPFFPLATISLGFFPEILISYIILSILSLLNLYHLFWAPPFSFLESLLKIDSVKTALSIINLIVFIKLIHLTKKINSLIN
ncbi:MAG TPA: hypothetical protein VF185_04415 [Patescibacteria group bacterium]